MKLPTASRREFLRQSAAAAATALLLTPTSLLASWSGVSGRKSIYSMSVADWRGLRGERFRVRDEAGQVRSMRLVRVSDRSHLTRKEGIEQLSLIFRSGAQEQPRQFVGSVTQAKVDGQSLLLVPVVRPEGLRGPGVHFEAVLSRFV